MFPMQYQIFIFAYLMMWVYFANYFQLYDAKKVSNFIVETFDIIRTTTLCLTLASIPAFFIREYPLSRLFLVYWWLFQIGALVFIRLIFRETLKYIRGQGYNYRSILLIGQNDRAAKYVKMIEDSPELGHHILGIVDAPNAKYDCNKLHRYQILGPLDNFERILRQHVVDEVVIFLPMKSFYAEIEDILYTCLNVGVEVKIPADLFTLDFAKSVISFFGDIPIIDYFTSPRMSWPIFLKRLIDMIISGVMLIFLCPIFILLGILIKATSKGPVFFRQKRVGYNGRSFNCLKFRTMVENAEELKKQLLDENEMDGPVFKIKHDPRVTPVGRFLRKTSLDELPQLMNVFIGDMSLVGPRPPIPGEVVEYDLKDLKRLSMRPGITCSWQVSGRNTISFKKWMELDRQYIDHWSLMLDFKILAKTIPAVLRRDGAA